MHDIALIFHDFPGRLLFSMTFQAWKLVCLNSMTFQDQWSPWTTLDSLWRGMISPLWQTDWKCLPRTYVSNYYCIQFGNISHMTNIRHRKKIAYHLRFLRLKHRVIYLVRTFRHILRLFYQLRRVHVTQRNNTECIDVLNKQTHKCDKVTKSNALPVDIKCTIHIIIHCNIPSICFQVLCSVCE